MKRREFLTSLLASTMFSCSSGKDKLPKTAIVDSHPNFFISNYVGNLESNNNLINNKVSFKDTLNGGLIYLIPNGKVPVSPREKYPNLKGLKIERIASNVYEINELIYSQPDSTSKK